MIDFSDYESPIKIVLGEMQTKMENDIVTAVQSYSVEIDKEELLKLINYDRDQFKKGYISGMKWALYKFSTLIKELEAKFVDNDGDDDE